MREIAVVTAITGKAGVLINQPEYENVDYIAFMDKETIHPFDELYKLPQKMGSWEVRASYDKFKDPVMNAKIHKVLTHKYINNEYIVWMDSTIVLKQDPQVLVDLMGNYNFAFFKHSGRKCLYKEIDICLKVGKGNADEIVEQGIIYNDELGFPKNVGLYELTAFIRKNNIETNTLFEKWWAEICRYSSRDQISFPVIFRHHPCIIIPGKVRYYKPEDENDYFYYYGK